MKFPAFLTASFKKPIGITGILIGKLMTKMNSFIYPEIDKNAQIKDNMNILEIGFGTGIGIKYFLNKYNIIFDGIDFSSLMFNKVEKEFTQYISNKKLNIICADFNTYNNFTKSYDRIIFSNVIYFWNNLSESFQKIKELLKENGKLIFYMSDGKFLKKSPLTHEKNFNFYEIEEVIKTLNNLKFKNISYKSIDGRSDYSLIVTAQK